VSQKQSIFCSARKHSIRLFGSSRDQIVNQDTNVSLSSGEEKWRTVLNFQSRIGSGDQALCRCLFVSRRAVNLAGKIEPAD
jgi:hypothetical protein